MVSAFDNCSMPENIQLSFECLYSTKFLWIYIREEVLHLSTHECGNTTELTQEIIVTDEALPIFTFIPSDISVNCGEAYELLDAEATDDCSDVTVTVSESNPNCAGGFTRTFTAVDGCGSNSHGTEEHFNQSTDAI